MHLRSRCVDGREACDVCAPATSSPQSPTMVRNCVLGWWRRPCVRIGMLLVKCFAMMARSSAGHSIASSVDDVTLLDQPYSLYLTPTRMTTCRMLYSV